MSNLSLREMMARMVSINSVSSVSKDLDVGNLRLVQTMANWLEDEGWRVELLPVQSQRGPKANLLATRGEGQGGLLLSGHGDTVPFDADLWSSEPLTLAERDGSLFGMGITDMKGFIAMAIEAAREFDDAQLSAPISLLVTADEESGMTGARQLAQEGRCLARQAIIGEPTGWTPVRLHKGAAMEFLQIEGRSGHSSNPALGINALDAMRVALDTLVNFRESLAHTHAHDALLPPVPTLNLGRIEGGDNPNRICGRCRLEFDLRVLPGMSAQQVRKQLAEALSANLDALGVAWEQGPIFPSIPPFETQASADIVRVAEQLSGASAEGVSFGTEGPFFNAMGMDTVVWGPGDIDVAHQPNESLCLAGVARGRMLLRRAIAHFCVEGESL